nr:N-6 DNA methylase [Prolixibacteraceae bacterium]
ERIRTKLLKDNNIDTVIGLPSKLFYSTGIPVSILVLKKCKKEDDVLFINASEHYEKGTRQNTLREGENEEPNDIRDIVETYKYRKEIERYSRKVSMDEIEKNGYNLNISRYVSTAEDEIQIDLNKVNERLTSINEKIKTNTDKHNEFLKELGLPPV